MKKALKTFLLIFAICTSLALIGVGGFFMSQDNAIEVSTENNESYDVVKNAASQIGVRYTGGSGSFYWTVQETPAINGVSWSNCTSMYTSGYSYYQVNVAHVRIRCNSAGNNYTPRLYQDESGKTYVPDNEGYVVFENYKSLSSALNITATLAIGTTVYIEPGTTAQKQDYTRTCYSGYKYSTLHSSMIGYVSGYALRGYYAAESCNSKTYKQFSSNGYYIRFGIYSSTWTGSTSWNGDNSLLTKNAVIYFDITYSNLSSKGLASIDVCDGVVPTSQYVRNGNRVSGWYRVTGNEGAVSSYSFLDINLNNTHGSSGTITINRIYVIKANASKLYNADGTGYATFSSSSSTYAMGQYDKLYTVTVNAGEGGYVYNHSSSSGMVTSFSVQTPAGQSITRDDDECNWYVSNYDAYVDAYAYAKQGYYFSHWEQSPSGSTITQNVTVRACFSRGTVYDLTYDGNGGNVEINSDMRLWKRYYVPSAFDSISYSSNSSTVKVSSVGGWEILGIRLGVCTNTNYSISVDVSGANVAGPSIMALYSTPTNSDCSSISLASSQVGANFSGTKTLSFNSGTYGTIYLIVNFGYMGDSQTKSFTFTNWRATSGKINSVGLTSLNTRSGHSTSPGNSTYGTQISAYKDGYSFAGWSPEPEMWIDDDAQFDQSDSYYYYNVSEGSSITASYDENAKYLNTNFYRTEGQLVQVTVQASSDIVVYFNAFKSNGISVGLYTTKLKSSSGNKTRQANYFVPAETSYVKISWICSGNVSKFYVDLRNDYQTGSVVSSSGICSSSKTLVASYRPMTYQVVYDLQGVAVTSSMPTDHEQVYHDKFRESLPQPTPVDVRIKFVCWSLYEGGTSSWNSSTQLDDTNADFDHSNETMTLYAVWEYSVSVSYNINDGSGRANLAYDTTGGYYSYSGITVSFDSGTETYTINGTCTATNSWFNLARVSANSLSQNDVYTLVFYKVSGSTSSSSGSFYPCVNVEVLKSNGGAVSTRNYLEIGRDAYLGSATTSAGLTINAASASEGAYLNVRIGYGASQVYNNFKFKIAVFKGTGFGASAFTPMAKVIKTGDTYVLPSVSRTGYTFGSWNTNSSGTGTIVTTDTIMDKTSDHTIYAQWTANQYTVTAKGATNAVFSNTSGWTKSGDNYTKTVTFGSTYGALPTLSRVGYTTSSWKVGSSSINSNSTVTTASNHDITVTFTANSHALELDANGGTYSALTGWTLSDSNKKATKNSITYGSLLTDLIVPTRTGYTFGGYYYEISGNSSNVKNYGREYMYESSISVHMEAHSTNWSSYSGRLISCTESGGFNIENNGGYIQYAAYDKGVGYKVATASIKWSDLATGWHTFDLVFDGTKATGYLDGTLIATGANYTSNPKRMGYQGTNSIFLGAEANSSQTSPDSGYFGGYIGNVAIKNQSTLISNDDAKRMYLATSAGTGSTVKMKAHWIKNGATPKYDMTDKYWYYEDGTFPQTYVGDTLNTTLKNASSSVKVEQYSLTIGGRTMKVYSYQNAYYGELTAEKSGSVLLHGKTAYQTVTSGQKYYFKVEPIRWRISDYGASPTLYSVGGDWGVSSVTGTSDILGYGYLKSDRSATYGQSASALLEIALTSTNISFGSTGRANVTSDLDSYKAKTTSSGTTNVSAAKIENATNQTFLQYDSTNGVYLRVASKAEIKANKSSFKTYASDLSAMMCARNYSACYGWTRNLYNFGSVYAVGSGGAMVEEWFNSLNGYIFAHTISGL